MRRLLLLIALASIAALASGSTPAAAAIREKTFNIPVTTKPFEVRQDYTLVPRPNVNAYIIGMSVNVVDDNGKQVPIRRLMLHHVVFAALGKPNATCQGQTSFGFNSRPSQFGNYAQPFYGAGEERNVLALPSGYGYPIQHNAPSSILAKWGMVWMLMNHRGVTDHAFVQYRVKYDDTPAKDGLTAVTPYWLDVRNCHADPVFDVPGGGKRGSTYKQTFDYTMPESGRIVAGGGHVHGGARNLVVSEPGCKRKVFTSRPAWGMPGNAFYHVRPILHEPGPISMSGYLTQQGYPIAKGQRLRLTANYDNSRPHTRVMGISVVYIAPQTVPAGCAPKPTDGATFQPAKLRGEAFRKKPPRFVVPLTGVTNGVAHTIKRPPGRTVSLKGGSTISAFNFGFSRPNVAVRPGSLVNWSFGPTTLHNVTLANGPRGFSSPNLNQGRKFHFRFRTPGTYRIFCALHPTRMVETVTVKRRRH